MPGTGPGMTMHDGALMSQTPNLAFATRCVHAGLTPDPSIKSLVETQPEFTTPIWDYLNRRITDLDDQEAGVIRAALEKTERIIVLADGSKFGDVALSTVVPINRVSAIVTDPSADQAEVERIAHEGVKVIVVDQ